MSISHHAQAFHTQQPYVAVANGGNLVQVRTFRSFVSATKDHRSTRGTISGFSRKSRTRMRRVFGSLLKTATSIFGTLTLPDDVDHSPDAIKKWLDTLGKRMVRAYPNASLIWRMELEPRKSGSRQGERAPHFHVMVYGLNLPEAREILSKWLKIVPSQDPSFQRQGVRQVQVMRSFRGVMSYVSKYMSKTAASAEAWTGRVWGIINRSALPVAKMAKYRLSASAAYRVVRWLVRLCAKRNEYGKIVKWGRVSGHGLTLVVDCNVGRRMAMLAQKTEPSLSSRDGPDDRLFGFMRMSTIADGLR